VFRGYAGLFTGHLPHSLRTLAPHPASVSTYVFCSGAESACRKYSLLPAKEVEACLRVGTKQSTAVADRPNKDTMATRLRILDVGVK
jgi:hypothetical protein